MSMHERPAKTFNELLKTMQEHSAGYGDEIGHLPVIVQDDNGIYESKVIAFDLANGPFIIVETQPKEE
jgi:hypothetical protein